MLEKARVLDLIVAEWHVLRRSRERSRESRSRSSRTRRCWPPAAADRSTATRPILRLRRAMDTRSRTARGRKLADMEFVQFHPTALDTPENPLALISEAVRGEGAVLLNEELERFMLKRHRLAELAPRDVVAREIFRENARGAAASGSTRGSWARPFEGAVSGHLRALSSARNRSGEGPDSGDAGRALHDGRHRH